MTDLFFYDITFIGFMAFIKFLSHMHLTFFFVIIQLFDNYEAIILKSYSIIRTVESFDNNKDKYLYCIPDNFSYFKISDNNLSKEMKLPYYILGLNKETIKYL